MGIKEILVVFVVFFANIVEAITGFAGTMLAMPFAMTLLGVKEAKVVLNVVAIFVSVTLACKNTRDIHKKEAVKISGLMLTGMLAGFTLFSLFPAESLARAYGVLILLIALKGLFIRKEASLPGWIAIVVVLGAGVIHGMFLSGGSLLVIYAVAVLKEKAVIRATLAPVWVLLNGVILVQDLVMHNFTTQTIALSLLCLPMAALAMFVGNQLHKRIPQAFFIRLTYCLLILSGLTLLA